MVRSVEGADTVPVAIRKSRVVVAAFAPKLHDAPTAPLKKRLLNADDVATMSLVADEVEFKVTICPRSVFSLEVELANQLPASVIGLVPIVKMEVVAVPSCRKPVARRRVPSDAARPLP